MNLHVVDRESLVLFLRELSEISARDESAIGNSTVPSYIEAASGWIADMDGYYHHCGVDTPEHPTWEMIALIFNAALNYDHLSVGRDRPAGQRPVGTSSEDDQ